MTTSLSNSTSSLTVRRHLSNASETAATSAERLASGQRINRASDDSAGLTLASKLHADGRVYTEAIRNLNDGISAISISSSAFDALTSIVDRLKELASQASNGAYTSTQRAALDSEAQSLSSEYSRIVETAAYNGLKLIDGSLPTLSVQAGYGAQEQITTTLAAAPLLSQSSTATTLTPDGEFTDAAGTLDYGGDDLELADLNNDGNIDIITFRSDRIVYALGNGDGTFGSYTIEFQGGNTWGIVSGDVTGDGYVDIIASDLYDGGVHIFENQGDGTLVSSFFVDTSGTPGGVQVGDVNGDGKLDVVVTDYSINKISVALGNGDGTFQAQKTFNTATKPGSLVLEDFDNDGKLDVITGNASTLSVLKGNGDGTFAAATTKTVTTSLEAIESADLNNDGNLDLIVTRRLFPTGEILVFLGNGNMTFGAAFTMYADGQTDDTTVGDFNGDGNLDIAASNYWQNISLFFGNGDGKFQAEVVIDSPAGSPTSIEAADINNDGVLDLSFGIAFNGTQILLGNSTTSSTGSTVSIDLTTQSAAEDALDSLEIISDSITVQRGIITAAQSRFEAALRVVVAKRENFLAAESSVTDVDVSSEMATYAIASVRKTASASLLSEINKSGTSFLDLIDAASFLKG